MQVALTKTRAKATAKAMMDAVGRLVNDGSVCCSFSDLIVGKHTGDTDSRTEGDSDDQTKGKSDADDDAIDDVDEDGLNPNQVRAVESSDNPLALIWGPPGMIGIPLNINDPNPTCSSGTGKTTVVVKILRKFFKTLDEDEKILMTASTHNGTSLL